MNKLFVGSQTRFATFVQDDQEGDLVNLQRLLIEGLNIVFGKITIAHVLECKEWVEEEKLKKVSEKLELWYVQDGLNRKIAEVRVDLSECFTVLRKLNGDNPGELDMDLMVAGMRTWLDMNKKTRGGDYKSLMEFIDLIDIWLKQYGSLVEYLGVSDQESIQIVAWIPMCNQCRITFEIIHAPWLH